MSMDRGPAPPPRGASLAGFPPPSSFHRNVRQILLAYFSEPTTRAVMVAIENAARIRFELLAPEHVPCVILEVEKAFDSYPPDPTLRAACLQSLRKLGAPAAPAPFATRGPSKTLLVLVNQERDIVRARLAAVDMCRQLGFSELACTKVMTSVSELARNLFKYAGEGQIAVTSLEDARGGVEIMACDQGPGIANIEAVMSDDYRSRNGMGSGLKGVRRVMDYFNIESAPGEGTVVVVRKFKS